MFEAVSFTGSPSVTIKSHHTVGGLPGAGSPQAIELLNCCGPGLEIVDEALQYSEQAIREALERIP